MIHGLRWCKFADRRQHTKGIAGQENDILGMSSNAGNFCV
jgi:hypothetical protein